MNPITNEQKLALNLDLVPMRLSEIVLKTGRYSELRIWYQMMLGIAPFYEFTPQVKAAPAPGQTQERASDLRLCFFRTHMEHPYAQVVALFDIPGTRTEPAGGDPGLHHMQLRCPDMAQLCTRYERLKSAGLKPHRTSNHGPGTSFYYRDPDGNAVEISANNFITLEEYRGFFESEGYKKNPSGIEIDADEYVARFRSGVPLAELVKIG
jgi:catechol 2,3-dioxygenase-like lactoylglutathione lyase family enzyme